MIEQKGHVVTVENQAIWVQTESSNCSKCAMGQGCGQGLISNLLLRKPNHIRLEIPEVIQQNKIAIGDEVLLGIPENAVMQASLLLYLMPLLGLLFGAITGQAIFSSELASILTAIIGLSVGFVSVKVFLFYSQHQHIVYQPILLNINRCPNKIATINV